MDIDNYFSMSTKVQVNQSYWGVHVGGSNNLTRRRRRRRERIILVIGNGWVMGLYLKEEGGAGNWVIREIATHRRVVVGR